MGYIMRFLNIEDSGSELLLRRHFKASRNVNIPTKENTSHSLGTLGVNVYQRKGSRMSFGAGNSPSLGTVANSRTIPANEMITCSMRTCDNRAEHLPRRRNWSASRRPSDCRSATLPLSYEGRAQCSRVAASWQPTSAHLCESPLAMLFIWPVAVPAGEGPSSLKPRHNARRLKYMLFTRGQHQCLSDCSSLLTAWPERPLCTVRDYPVLVACPSASFQSVSVPTILINCPAYADLSSHAGTACRYKKDDDEECVLFTDNQTLNWVLNNPQKLGILG
ncbi:hypothetical protein PR048_023249 [Dryococelus australis]|uniref:FZ domain-containing protein n=1 Tax=Dryococelus australis TaxID=614101 RepID=A0ABQ9GTM5_9NEOP|nr:hypothetical protein PR048_023249 [Dryococelus australis]